MLKRINLPYGGIRKVAVAVNRNRDTVSNYLAGKFDENSKCYADAISVRETAKQMYKIK